MTDLAATMPAVLSSSVSPTKVPFLHMWVGCICHQLNTVMKITMDTADIKLSQIANDLKSVKSIVSTFNHTGMNQELEDSYKLVQEVVTRFGTTYDVVERFIKSKAHVRLLIEGRTRDVGENQSNKK